jgi:DNA polymerase (family 10)
VELYSHAGLAYLPPETRDSADALDRAQQRSLPRLVEREDIRGDLHMHTTYSDGREPLRRMAHGARALGYEYIAITDHSEHAGASRTLTPELLVRQREEIARLRREIPDMAILHGIEVDIMSDGSLDCPDDTLAGLDIVLASLHDSAGHSRAALTRRCIAAIEHPLVSVITHPANQLVGRRDGYDLDYDAVYAAAAAAGTALEVDGAPSHLDLSGDRAREAIEAGVTLVIDSDCHRLRALDRQMRMGVGTARRGWVEPRHVLNTRPLADVRAFIARKRTR